MARRIALLALAHGRSGDKGDAVNIGVIARVPSWFDFLRSELDSYKVARFLHGMADGPVERYELPNLHALNFLVHGALAGGGSVGLKIDAQGKTYAHALMRFPVEVPAPLFAEVEAYWKGAIPKECFYFAEAPSVADGPSPVLAESADRVLYLRINRPEARNALSLPLLDRLAAELTDVADTPGRREKVVVIGTSGPAFCAGMDIKMLARSVGKYEAMRGIAEALRRVYSAQISSPLPVIAAIRGSAMGGGFGLALASDIVVADRTAEFAFPEVKIGFVPGMVSAMAMRRLTPSVARELLLTGRRIGAEEAYQRGIVHHLVDGDPMLEAQRLATQMVREASADALARSKALLRQAGESQLLEEIRLAVDVFAGASMKASFETGVKSFTEKRKLDWSHDSREDRA